MGSRLPSGKPIPGQSTMGDVKWALEKIRRYIFRGGEWTPELHKHLDRWLDYSLELKEKFKKERECND